MKILQNIYIALGLLLLAGCADDYIPAPDNWGEFEEGPKVEAYLSLSVGNFTVSTAGTRAAEPSTDKEEATEAENRIDDIWVFQFDATTGQQLINPSYYEITDQEDLKNLKVLLKDGIESTIYVIANTGSADWCIGKDISHITQLKGMSLPNPAPIMSYELGNRCIPMNGILEKVTVIAGDKIEIKAKKMFAKLRIWFEKLPEGMTPKSVEINSIPNYCKVESVASDLTEDAGSYEVSFDWITRAFNAEESSQNDNTKKDEYVIFIPENIQGESDNTFEGNKNENAPSRALVINLRMRYTDPQTNTEEDREYRVYPGGNNYNNFNVRRNCVYRVKININSLSTDVHTPSANCFVVIPGRGLSFEPYYRTEIGGGYNFKDYMDPDDPDQTIIDEETGETKTITGDKVIDEVKIVWQTMEAIGDNTAGDKVWFEKNVDSPLHSKLFVKTNKEGNALVAAYNAKKEIIWSWHIWITGNDPGNVGNAINYTTYRWDGNGIYPNERQPGYAVMKCNLGALSNGPEEGTSSNTPNSSYVTNRRTSGMLYQWGRKDPFPPTKDRQNFVNYAMDLYDNSHSKIKMTTSGCRYTEHVQLFETVKATDETMIGNTKESGIKYSINHPTIFIAGADSLVSSSRVYPSSYINNGDWLPEGDDCLWGGLAENDNMMSLGFTLNAGTPGNVDVHIRENYGKEKTIYDPCPKGWRVPPGDLWLGFTIDGKNQKATNIDAAKGILNVLKDHNLSSIKGNNVGFWLCLDGWQSADISKYTFFPCQGTRLASGQPFGGAACGNYHNATVDGKATYSKYLNNPVNRLNILHVHYASNEIFIFPFDYEVWYNVKAIGGSVRCVRDTK